MDVLGDLWAHYVALARIVGGGGGGGTRKQVSVPLGSLLRGERFIESDKAIGTIKTIKNNTRVVSCRVVNSILDLLTLRHFSVYMAVACFRREEMELRLRSGLAEYNFLDTQQNTTAENAWSLQMT